MNLIISRKKVVFVFCFIFICLLSAGFYFSIEKGIFLIKKEIYGERNDIVTKSSDISEFEIKDVDGKKIIENKKEGFFAESPIGWIVKKYKYNDKENEVSLFSPESEFDEQGELLFKKSYLEKGACGIGVAIKKCEKNNPNIPTDAEMIFNYIMGIKSDKENSDNNWTVISIGGRDSLRRITKKDDQITSIMADAPIGQTIYSFATGYIVNQKCVKYFDDFLKMVLINK